MISADISRNNSFNNAILFEQNQNVIKVNYPTLVQKNMFKKILEF